MPRTPLCPVVSAGPKTGHASDDTAHIQKLFLFRHEQQEKFKPALGYLETVQGGRITAEHRRQLVDWIQQLAKYFGYQTTEAFQLSVNYLDRICSKHVARLSSYQAMGAACFLIAAKVCEAVPPSVAKLAMLSAGAFDIRILKEMELSILEGLGWDLNAAIPSLFLDTFVGLFPFKKSEREEVYTHADIFLGLIQSDYQFLRYRPSVQTAAALKCAFWVLGKSFSVFGSAISKEFNAMSLDPVAMVGGLEIPDMREINDCSRVMAELIKATYEPREKGDKSKCKDPTSSSLSSSSPHSNSSSSSPSERSCYGTSVRHGLATPTEEMSNENVPPLLYGSDPDILRDPSVVPRGFAAAAAAASAVASAAVAARSLPTPSEDRGAESD